MDSVNDDRGLLCRVAPFRYLRLNAYLQLTAAFRSLSRLSSALSAKASALRPTQLNQSEECIYNHETSIRARTKLHVSDWKYMTKSFIWRMRSI